MTKIEWATWMQVGVGVLAVYAAVRAVRAAHQLAMAAKADDVAAQALVAVQVEANRLENVQSAGWGITDTLADKRKLEPKAYARFRVLAQAVLDKNYGDFPVHNFAAIFVAAQQSLAGAVEHWIEP